MHQYPSPIIELKALTKIYEAGDGSAIRAVDNLSLTVPRGCVFGLLGANGAGKTTLVKLMGGLIVPTAGQISLNGHPVTPTQPLTVGEIGVILAEIWPEKKLKQWLALLRQGLPPGKTMDCLKAEWPYGKQRLVDFASIMLVDPPLVLVDEPFAGLEPQLAQTVKIWLAKLVYEQQKTVVIATEAPELVEELCTEVAIINHGRLVTQQPVAQLLRSPQAGLYHIKLKGHLAKHWCEWFDNLTITHTGGGETLLSGLIKDQAALYGVLIKIRDLALPLLSVTRTEPNLAQVMQSLTQAEHLCPPER
jgi:ABC-2 type transport system ATP-binding protein